jgi:hypothetical protein
MSASKAVLFASLAGLSFSCGHSKPRPAPPLPSVPVTVKLWAETADDLPKADVLAGCEAWRPRGVHCAFVASRTEADIWVVADRSPCKKADEDRVTLALAYRGGRIVMRTDCFMRKGVIVPEKFRTVMTHEVGHQLGIWDHVPNDCGGKTESGGAIKRHPNGRAVCGDALMDPYYDPKIPVPNDIDELAFDLRDLDISVITDPASDPGTPDKEPGCVYHE